MLGLNWQSNYKIGCNWNMKVYLYMTHNNTCLFSSIPLAITKPVVWNAGALYLQLRGISISKVQAPTELKLQYIYELSSSDDHPSEFIPLADYPSY